MTDIRLESPGSEAGVFTVLYWKVEVGERVAAGDELLVLEAAEEKTALTVESPVAGTLVEIVAGEEAEVSIGDLLGRIKEE